MTKSTFQVPVCWHIKAQTIFTVNKKNQEYFALNLNSHYLSRKLDIIERHLIALKW